MASKTAKKNEKKFTIGSIELDVLKKKGAFVPESEDFIDHDKLLETLAFALNEDLPTLLIGETGTGKTSAIRYLCNRTNRNFRRINLNGQTTVDEFVGKILVNEKGTYWVDGILTDAMRHGHVLLLDEVNAALPEILFALQSVLDDDKMLVLTDKEDKEIVRPHKDFRVFATMNPADNYVGTKDLNKAFLSRFPIVVQVSYPDAKREVEILKNKFPALDDYDATKLVDFAGELRQAYFKHELDFVMSTRELVNWVKINQHVGDWTKSVDLTVLGKCSSEERKSIESLVKVHFKSDAVDASGLQETDEIIVFKDIDIYNTDKKVMAKTTLRVTRNMPNSSIGHVLQVEVGSTPQEAREQSEKYALKGDVWAIDVNDLGSSFSLKRKRS